MTFTNTVVCGGGICLAVALVTILREHRVGGDFSAKRAGQGKETGLGKAFRGDWGGGFPLKEAATPGIAVFDKTHLSRQVDSMLLLANQISMINDKKRILANQRENQKEERIANPTLNS